MMVSNQFVSVTITDQKTVQNYATAVYVWGKNYQNVIKTIRIKFRKLIPIVIFDILNIVFEIHKQVPLVLVNSTVHTISWMKNAYILMGQYWVEFDSLYYV